MRDHRWLQDDSEGKAMIDNPCLSTRSLNSIVVKMYSGPFMSPIFSIHDSTKDLLSDSR